MTDLNKPNSDQASERSLAGTFGDVLTRWLRNEVDDMLPARVVSYDDATNRAVIQPLVMVGTTAGAKVSRASIPNIPVFRFGGGGFFVRFPLKPGDVGWLKANDRDISLVMQAAGGQDWPNTKRLHSFSDAMFYPDTFKQWVIAGANADAAVLQSLDGAVVVALHADKLVLEVAPSIVTLNAAGITLDGPVVTINAANAITLTSPAGTLTHNGKNVGDTHTHNGSPSAPAGPVSATGVPI